MSGSGDALPVHIPKLLLGHAEIVAQFMDDRSADLFADFGLAGADQFDFLDKTRCNRVPSAGQRRSSWSWARRGRDPEAAAFGPDCGDG